MEQFKSDFETKHNERWTFQDEFTEERYKNFKEAIDAESGKTNGFSGRDLTTAEIDAVNQKRDNFNSLTKSMQLDNNHVNPSI